MSRSVKKTVKKTVKKGPAKAPAKKHPQRKAARPVKKAATKKAARPAKGRPAGPASPGVTAKRPVNKGGRPPVEVDRKLVEGLAAIGCTQREIAAALGVSQTTISTGFQSELDLGAQRLKTSLRRLQWRSADSGNVKMLIWLGKQYLQQCEPMRVQMYGEDVPRVAGKTAAEFDSETVKLIFAAIEDRRARRAASRPAP